MSARPVVEDEFKVVTSERDIEREREKEPQDQYTTNTHTSCDL